MSDDPDRPPLTGQEVIRPARDILLEPSARTEASIAAGKAEDPVDYARLSLAPNTLRAYQADWDDYLQYCRAKGYQPLPAAHGTVAAYLSSLAKTHGRSALRRRLSAIAQAHRLKGVDWAADTLIRRTLAGIARQHGVSVRKAAALTTPEIKRLLATCDHGLTGRRDKAMILIGYAGALRRSEIVGIAVEHITFTTDGLRLHLPRSKTDQENQGDEIGIPKGERRDTCPVKALQDWLEMSKTEYGPIFRKIDMWGGIDHVALQSAAVRDILRKHAAQANITVGALERLSPHGLRAGFITEAHRAGVPDEAIMGHTRHKDIKTMRGYVRRAKLLTESPAKKLGL